MILSVDSILRLVIYSTVATETPSPSWSFELSETVAYVPVFISSDLQISVTGGHGANVAAPSLV